MLKQKVGATHQLDTHDVGQIYTGNAMCGIEYVLEASSFPIAIVSDKIVI